MIDLEKERKAFEEQWRLLGGHLLYVEWSTDNMYSLSPAAKVLNKNDQISLFNTINTAWGLWVVQAKQNKTVIDSLKAENAALKERLQKIEDGEFVVVPKECPDPIFADKLFDLLCKKAHGEFGDDQMIFFSDIDESAIWKTMIEAAQGETK